MSKQNQIISQTQFEPQKSLHTNILVNYAPDRSPVNHLTPHEATGETPHETGESISSVANRVVEGLKQSLEDVMIIALRFTTSISSKSRKTPTINLWATALIDCIADLYTDLYNISESIRRKSPTIKDGTTLRTILMSMYERTTLKRMEEFVFFLDLIKVVMSTFIEELRGSVVSEGTESSAAKIHCGIEEKCRILKDREFTLDKETFFEVTEDGTIALRDDIRKMLSPYQKYIKFCGMKLELGDTHLCIDIIHTKSDALVKNAILKHFQEGSRQQVHFTIVDCDNQAVKVTASVEIGSNTGDHEGMVSTVGLFVKDDLGR
jgi:hypothetical protein